MKPDTGKAPTKARSHGCGTQARPDRGEAAKGAQTKVRWQTQSAHTGASAHTWSDHRSTGFHLSERVDKAGRDALQLDNRPLLVVTNYHKVLHKLCLLHSRESPCQLSQGHGPTAFRQHSRHTLHRVGWQRLHQRRLHRGHQGRRRCAPAAAQQAAGQLATAAPCAHRASGAEAHDEVRSSLLNLNEEMLLELSLLHALELPRELAQGEGSAVGL
mmetsp:Transcript_59869/g.165645  ORF Transcript_59869/g.165645 Transcript_59869/m.165645 type:complete len:215 (-) Transcript_59869:377-1021(-)